MNRRSEILAAIVAATFLLPALAIAGPAATTIREAAEFIIGKFGKGAAGQTVGEVAEATAKAVA